MKKYNGIDYRWVLMGIILPILVFFIAMRGTYAYFTATAGEKNAETSTGIIRLEITEHAPVVAAEASEETVKLIPGDTLSIDGKIANTGTSPLYAILKLELVVEKTDGSVDTAIVKYFTYANSKYVEFDIDNYAGVVPFEMAKDEVKNYSLPHEFAGAGYNDDYQNATCTYVISAFGIQKSNVSTSLAINELVGLATA